MTARNLATALGVGLFLMVAPVTAQHFASPQDQGFEDQQRGERRPPGDRQRRPRDPEELRRRIAELRAQDPGDPRIERLEQLLERLESQADEAQAPDGAERKGPRFTQDQVEDFLKAHPELAGLSPPASDPRGPRGPRRRGASEGPALHQIMEAFEDGDVQRGELMISGAVLHAKIRETVRSYRQAAEDGDLEDAARIRDEIRTLVVREVRLDHEIKGLELARLRQRLEEQTRRHEEQAGRLDQTVERRVEMILERRQPGEPGARGKSRAKGPRFDPFRGQAPESDPDDPTPDGDEGDRD
jgi:hypothetical protein